MASSKDYLQFVLEQLSELYKHIYETMIHIMSGTGIRIENTDLQHNQARRPSKVVRPDSYALSD